MFTSTFGAVILASILACVITTIGIFMISRFEAWGNKNIVYFISFALFVIISWQAMKYTFITWEGALRSEVLKIPTGPFMLVVALGCIALTLILLMDFLRSVNKVVKK